MNQISHGNLLVGEQSDGSIIDKNGLLMDVETREEILQSTYSLPIYQDSIKSDICYHLRNGNDLIIDGSTGSGKSTGAPIFAREATGKKVIQTMPRVLAAMSCAKRISQILLAQTGDPKYTLGYDEVGYRTGVGVSSSRIAKLSAHTDGTEVMRQLYSDIYPPILFIDEIQNKSVATEILLYLAKHNLDVQLVIMSATLNPKIYQQFLKARGREIPIVTIPGRTFPIKEHYSGSSGAIQKTISLAQKGQHGLHIVSGKAEIEDRIQELQCELGTGYDVLPLHAELSEEDQYNATILGEGDDAIKIVVATNVAEESITIPHLDFVVDEGNHKVGRINMDGISELRVEPITLANTKQRAGRVGRTHPGEYHRHNDIDLSDLHEYPEADIENNTLEREILLFSQSGRDLRSLLSKSRREGSELFLHKVDRNLLNIGYERLARIGALDIDANITPLGVDLLSISLDPYHARMVIEGIINGCAEEMVIIASILSVNGFLSKNGEWKQIKNGVSKKTDFFAYIDIYNLISKSSLDQSMIEKLLYLGIDRDQLLNFQHNSTGEALFEVVDLEVLGIKNHKVFQIHNKISLLKKSLSQNGVSIPNGKAVTSKSIQEDDKVNGILTSISSGYPFYVFSYNPKTKKFEHDDKGGKRTPSVFQIASVSSVNPSPGKLYIGEPFIIGGDDFSGSQDFNINIDDVFFESNSNYEYGDDLCILSHISEIDSSHLKQAQVHQDTYRSVFTASKKIISKNTGIDLGIFQMMEEYRIIREEIGKGTFSHEEFLEEALPLLLMSYNHKFKKFLLHKNSDVINKLKQRLARFLKNNKGNYLHRISDNIERIERSFGDDSEIYNDFRSWEQSSLNRKKGAIREGKKISRIDLYELENKRKTSESRQSYVTILGKFTGANFDDSLGAIESKILGKLMTHLIMSEKNFNNLKGEYESEILVMDQSTRQTQVGVIKDAERKKSEERHYKTRISTILEFIKEVKKIITYCNSSSNANYEAIDFDYFISIFSNPKNREKEDIPTKSQLDKYYKGLKAVQKFHSDQNAQRRSLNALQRASRFFESLIPVYDAKKDNLVKELEEKKREIEKARVGKLKTREALCNFFSHLYKDEYYLTQIEPKINTILKQILSPNTYDLEDTISQFLIEKFPCEKLRQIKDTKQVTTFLGLKRKYEKLLKQVQKSISKLNKLQEPSNEDYDELRSYIEESMKTLYDYKSQIHSL